MNNVHFESFKNSFKKKHPDNLISEKDLENMYNFVYQNVKNLTLSKELLFSEIFNFFGITKDQLMSRSRKQEVVQARNVYMLTFKFFSNRSLTSVGNDVYRDHSTVVHAIKNYKNGDHLTKKGVDDFILHIEKING